MIDCRFSKPCPSQIALRLLVILPGALNSAETADQKRRNPSWSLEPACKGAEWDWDDLRFKKAEDNIGLKTAETSCWRKQFSWDSIGRCSKLVRVRWYVQGFIWQHMRLKTKTLSHDTPTWDSCLLDRVQRREHPLDRCCNIHWTASNRSAWLTIKCCRVCKTSTPHLPPFALVHHVAPVQTSTQLWEAACVSRKIGERMRKLWCLCSWQGSHRPFLIFWWASVTLTEFDNRFLIF